MNEPEKMVVYYGKNKAIVFLPTNSPHTLLITGEYSKEWAQCLVAGYNEITIGPYSKYNNAIDEVKTINLGEDDE